MHHLDKHPSPSERPSRVLGTDSCNPVVVTGLSCVTEPGGTCVLTLAGEFDLDTTPAVRDTLAAIRTSTAQRTIIDLSGVAFADSALLNLLLTARRGQVLVLAGPLHSQLRLLLELTGTAALFTIADDVAAAHRLSTPPSSTGVDER